jgi:hypothetical protein
VTTFEGTPQQIEDGLNIFREQVLPWFDGATGFRGFIALLDRERGRSMGITFWATAEAAADSPESGANLRDEVVERIGVKLKTVDLYEVAAADALALTKLD